MAPPGTHSIAAAASSTRWVVHKLTPDLLSGRAAKVPLRRGPVCHSFRTERGACPAAPAAATPAAATAAAAATPRARTGRVEAAPASAAPPAAPPFMIELIQA